MNFKALFTSILTLLLYTSGTCADSVVTFFLKKYPTKPESSYCKAINEKLKRPGKIAKHCVYGILDKGFTSGIFSSYAGFLTTSDANGQITFPRKHTASKVKLLITSKLTPIIMAGNTIHHWELEDGTPAIMYGVEREQDKDTGLYYWNVQQEALPKNNRIPLETVIILAKTHHIYVPEGVSVTTKSSNLVLPDIYVKKGIRIVSNALYILNLRQFFGQLGLKQKNEKIRYQSRIID